MNIKFNELGKTDILAGCMYESEQLGTNDILKEMIGCGTIDGFRKIMRIDDRNKVAYYLLCNTLSDDECGECFDEDTNVYTLYAEHHGNMEPSASTYGMFGSIKQAFTLSKDKRFNEIPPFFLFNRHGGPDGGVQFIGVAVPSENENNGESFHASASSNIRNTTNYMAKFTILDTGHEVVQREWLDALLHGSSQNAFAPKAWLEYLGLGE